MPCRCGAESRHRNCCGQLLKQHAAVNAAQADGTTALHWAAHWNDSEAVSLLLPAGADAKAANRYGATPLSEAAALGNARDHRATSQGRRRSQHPHHRRRRDGPDDSGARRQSGGSQGADRAMARM